MKENLCLSILFLMYIIMSNILIKKQKTKIEKLYNDLEEQYLKRYEQALIIKHLKMKNIKEQ